VFENFPKPKKILCATQFPFSNSYVPTVYYIDFSNSLIQIYQDQSLKWELLNLSKKMNLPSIPRNSISAISGILHIFPDKTVDTKPAENLDDGWSFIEENSKSDEKKPKEQIEKQNNEKEEEMETEIKYEEKVENNSFLYPQLHFEEKIPMVLEKQNTKKNTCTLCSKQKTEVVFEPCLCQIVCQSCFQQYDIQNCPNCHTSIIREIFLQ